MTTYSVYRNVEVEYDLPVEGYLANIKPLVEFAATSGFTIDSPTLTIFPLVSFSSTATIEFTATVTPISPELFNGITTLSAKVTGMSHTGAGKVVTLTTPNGFTVGDSITVAGVNAAFTVTNVDGSWTAETGTDETRVVFTVTSTPVGTTPQTLDGGTVVGPGDCYILDPTTFVNDSTTYSIGNYTVVMGDWSNSYPYKVWIPFVVDIAKDTVIRLATLSVVATSNGDSDGGVLSIRVGCENAGDALAPSDFNDVNLRPLSDGYVVSVLEDISVWTAGTTYTYDITTAVQSVLNDDDWVTGNTLAVIFLDYGSERDVNVSIASFENTTYTAPTLVIIG
jgi:hypothetical protein